MKIWLVEPKDNSSNWGGSVVVALDEENAYELAIEELDYDESEVTIKCLGTALDTVPACLVLLSFYEY